MDEQVTMEAQGTSDLRCLGFTPADVAVITGAGSGIGRATALAAGRSGLTVAAWDADAAAAKEAVAEIESTGGAGRAVEVDVTVGDSVDSALDRTRRLGRCRYLVNNAGPPSSSAVEFMDGVAAALGSVQRVTELWLGRVGDEMAGIVNVSSIAGNFVAGGVMDFYAASKAAIAAYTRQLAVRRGGRPRVNAVAPGLTDTARTRQLIEQGGLVGRNPMGRAGQPIEVANAICFLLSPAAGYINGALLPIDGGGIHTS